MANKYEGSKTEKNLWEAFAGESQARNKYTYYASAAKKAGFRADVRSLSGDGRSGEGACKDVV